MWWSSRPSLYPSTSLLRRISYGHDRIGNITALTDARGPSSFQYDPLYRLELADLPGAAEDEGFTYDGVGNRETTTVGGVSMAYQYDDGNRLLTIRSGLDPDSGPLLFSFGHDDNGNLVERRDGGGTLLQSLVYDQKDRATSIATGPETVWFEYDPLDYRIEKSGGSGTVRSLLEGEHLEAVYDGAGVLGAKYLRGVVIDEIVNGYLYDAAGRATNYTLAPGPVEDSSYIRAGQT